MFARSNHKNDEGRAVNPTFVKSSLARRRYEHTRYTSDDRIAIVMGLTWLGQAWQINFGSTPRKMIALAIADCHNEETDRCFPGVAYIARKVNLEEGNVRRHIATLIEERWLEKEGTHYRRGDRWMNRVIDLAQDQPEPSPTAVMFAEIADARNRAANARNRAPDRAESRAEARGIARVIRKEPELQPEQNTYDASTDFDVFWLRYPHRGGTKRGKSNSLKQWGKLKEPQRVAAVEALDDYRVAAGEYAKDPERYLSHKLWVGLEVKRAEPLRPRPAPGPVPSTEKRDDAPRLDPVAAKQLLDSMRINRKRVM